MATLDGVLQQDAVAISSESQELASDASYHHPSPGSVTRESSSICVCSIPKSWIQERVQERKHEQGCQQNGCRHRSSLNQETLEASSSFGTYGK